MPIFYALINTKKINKDSGLALKNIKSSIRIFTNKRLCK